MGKTKTAKNQILSGINESLNFHILRRDGDSNPGTALDGYTLSRPANFDYNHLFSKRLGITAFLFTSYLQVFGK